MLNVFYLNFRMEFQSWGIEYSPCRSDCSTDLLSRVGEPSPAFLSRSAIEISVAMPLSDYLTQRAASTALSRREQASIDRSIHTLQARLNEHFCLGEVKRHFRFGSSTRDTMLPRSIDDRSDIDYMVVFSRRGLAPQTYLNWLRTFAEQRYGQSTIYQSAPTIVLELNHIKFDLVPATTEWLGGLRIPDKGAGWLSTDPNGFNSTLEQKDRWNHSLIRPTIKLVKWWNAGAGFPYESFLLEQSICELSFLWTNNQKDYFLKVIERLDPPHRVSKRAIEQVQRAKEIASRVRELDRRKMHSAAERELVKLFAKARP